jgi:hypothetical protein
VNIGNPNIGQVTLSFGPSQDDGVDLFFKKDEYTRILAMLPHFDTETLSIFIRNGRPMMTITSITNPVAGVTATDMTVNLRSTPSQIRIRLRTIVEILKEFTVEMILSQKTDVISVTVWSPSMQDLVVDGFTW